MNNFFLLSTLKIHKLNLSNLQQKKSYQPHFVNNFLFFLFKISFCIKKNTIFAK